MAEKDQILSTLRRTIDNVVAVEKSATTDRRLRENASASPEITTTALERPPSTFGTQTERGNKPF